MSSSHPTWFRALALSATATLLISFSIPQSATALAASRTASFSADDYCLGQCSDILPAGENGSATLAEILANQVSGAQPKHADDQRDPYSNLALGYKTLTDETLSTYFNDASFDVDPYKVESVSTPRSDATITRDTATGVVRDAQAARAGVAARSPPAPDGPSLVPMIPDRGQWVAASDQHARDQTANHRRDADDQVARPQARDVGIRVLR